MSWSKGDLIPEQPREVARLRARIAELEGKLAEAEARGVVLQKRLSALVANPVIAGMSAGIRDNARQRGRPDPYLAAEDALMNGVTEESQALTRLVEAAVEQRNAWGFQRKEDPNLSCCAPETARLIRAVDALLAARSGRGEGVPTPNRARRDRIEGAVRAIETLQAHGIYLHDAGGTPLGGAEFLAVMPSILEAMKDQPPGPAPGNQESNEP